jgi:hypothetical protein
MFAVLHSDINSLKSGPLHLTGQPYCKKSRSAKAAFLSNLIFFCNDKKAQAFNQDRC